MMFSMKILKFLADGIVLDSRFLENHVRYFNIEQCIFNH